MAPPFLFPRRHDAVEQRDPIGRRRGRQRLDVREEIRQLRVGQHLVGVRWHPAGAVDVRREARHRHRQRHEPRARAAVAIVAVARVAAVLQEELFALLRIACGRRLRRRGRSGEERKGRNAR